LYSFPDVVGKPGIGVAAAENARCLAALGVEVTLACTSVKPGTDLDGVSVRETLTIAGRRVPHRVLGINRSYAYHDRRAARFLATDDRGFDAVHVWPRAVLATAAAAAARGVPVLREVPNTHTAHAYEVVAAEHAKLGLPVPPDNSHAFDRDVLELEEREYAVSDVLLVPSDHSAETFQERGFDPARLEVRSYGFEPSSFYPDLDRIGRQGPLVALFAARCEPRKGLHHALDAWFASGVAESGRLLVAGEFMPEYEDLLQEQLAHPSVERIGFVEDLGAVMRDADVFLLPSVEEGSALVTYAAQASGCAILASHAGGARARHGEDGLIHRAGDAGELAEHIRLVHDDRELLGRLQRAGIAAAQEFPWAAAASELVEIYGRAARAG
jgi:glycosyltransferase involved in cell wall biosynthesis